jgi:hypothetical protein
MVAGVLEVSVGSMNVFVRLIGVETMDGCTYNKIEDITFRRNSLDRVQPLHLLPPLPVVRLLLAVVPSLCTASLLVQTALLPSMTLMNSSASL